MVTALIKLLDWFKNYRLATIKARAEADNMQFMLMKDMVVANTKIIEDWLQGFKVSEIPTSTIVRDEDEYTEEQNRLHPGIRASVQNAIRAGAFPDLNEILRDN